MNKLLILLENQPIARINSRIQGKEMNGIARTVLSFLEKYESLQQISEEQLNNFLIDLENISKVIHERMQREEEKLYPLYLQIAAPN